MPEMVREQSMKILAIHGAFSTPTIFNYAKSKIKNYDWQMFDYSEHINDFARVCEDAIYSITEPVHVIGHSMGGLIALSLSGHHQVRSITTIATPLDGLDVNITQFYLSRSNFIREMQRGSAFMRGIHTAGYPMPVQHIITIRGFNPYMMDDNDGVVTLRSQRGWSTGQCHEIEANHAEIMLHDDCIKQMRKFLAESESAQ
jgi:triacylglycerol esterase/lipase EstA (alpha/beta hydrolase family)